MAPLLRAVNAIAAAIEPEFPDVAVHTLAYQYTRAAPNVTVPRGNVVVQLCSIECSWAVPLSLFVAVLLALVHRAGYNSGKAVKRLDAAHNLPQGKLWIGISRAVNRRTRSSRR